MNRLTKDLHTPHDDTTYAEVVKDAIDRENIVLTKLKHYEDIEEELGIDLITLFKALKDRIYTRDYGYLLVEHFVLESEHELHCRPTYRKEIRFALKDYGKTWALSEKELENDK